MLNFEQSAKQLAHEHIYLEGIIGGWPTKIQSDTQRQQIVQRLKLVLEQANRLSIEQPNNLNLLWLVGDFYRMAHNADMPRAAQRAVEIFQQIIIKEPSHFDAIFSLARLYLNVDNRYASDAEQLLLKAQALAQPKVINSIDLGLFYACLYQGKKEQAITHLEIYLGNCPDDQEMAKMLVAVKNNQFSFTHQPLTETQVKPKGQAQSLMQRIGKLINK